MSIISDVLRKEFPIYNISFTDEMLSSFNLYSKLLIDWNNKINLTAIVDPREIAIKHFLDSALLLNALEIKNEARVIDIGTGAGFPGLPIKILRNDINLTLLDSLNKRLIFLEEVTSKLKINAEILHLRAEEGGKNPDLREKFDIVTSRAVAALNVLCEYCLPYVKVGGSFIAMKGPNADKEIEDSRNSIKLLGAEIEDVKLYTLADEGKRSILILRKIKNTNSKYPRHGGKIQKSPL